MPGLLRGVARTAAIAGTASAVSGRVQHRQAQKWAAQEAPQQQYAPPPQYAAPAPAPQYAAPEPVAAPAPVAESGDDMLEQLKKLGELRDAGVLTEAEFETQKARILGT